LRLFSPAAALIASLLAGSVAVEAGTVAAFGDVHGAYDELVALLRSQEIIDAAGSWRAGSLALVSLGDLVDRGDHGRSVIDLLMRLQPQAAAAGGRLHVVLGNHEVMNLTGELDYVSAGDYAQFAAEETAAMRDAAFSRLVSAGRFSDPANGRAEFDAAFPSGFFARLLAFAPNGRYGGWLLEQTIIQLLDGTLFLHGGVTPALAAESAADFSARVLGEVRSYATAWHEAMQEGLIDPDTPFTERVASARARAKTAEHRTLLAALAASEQSIAFDKDGPLWYRGQAWCHPSYETGVLNAVLLHQGARRVVVGHTPTPTLRVTSRFDGRVLLADTGMLRSFYGGHPALTYLEDDGVSVAYLGEAAPAAPLDDPIYVGSRSHGLDDDEVERRLAAAPIVASNALEGGRMKITLAFDGQDEKLTAVQLPLRGPPPWRGDRELDAYRLDRLLDLRLVPVAVAREVDGRTVVLQFQPAAITHNELEAQGGRRATWCPLRPQYDLMTVFDGLLGLGLRRPDSIHYTDSDSMLVLTGHGGAFGTSSQLPEHIREANLSMPPDLAERLAALDEKSLSMVLPTLSKGQIKALLERRDQLMQRFGSPGAEATRGD
jgi:hypothetical protein